MLHSSMYYTVLYIINAYIFSKMGYSIDDTGDAFIDLEMGYDWVQM